MTPKFSRAWAMPNGDTFSIRPIEALVRRYVEAAEGVIVDPFVRNSPFREQCLSNDLDPDINADFHEDALDFLKRIETGLASLVLYDPPYSPRQVSECYRKLGRTVNMQTTQASFWGNIKREIARIVAPQGHVCSFGWNSGGIGKTHGFQIQEILLVAHGGAHNDTICTVERKIR